MEGSSLFVPYPRTAHVVGSRVVDDDAAQEVPPSWLQQHSVVVTEKVDGTNVAVHFERPWMPLCQKRSGLLAQREHEQYVRFRDFCAQHVEALWEALSTRYVLFGEWLLCTHGVAYDALPSFFLAFDLFDKTAGAFVDSATLQTVLQGSGVLTVPVVATQWDGAVKQLEQLAAARSRFSTVEACEGVYVKFEANGRVVHRLKYRRSSFVAGRSDWSSNTVYNKLIV